MTIPSFAEKKKQVTSTDNLKVVELLERVARAIEKSDRYDYITVSTQGCGLPVVDVVMQELRAQGWGVKHTFDQRDGNFLTLGPPDASWLHKSGGGG